MRNKHIIERLDFMRAHLLANVDKPNSLAELEKRVNEHFLQRRKSGHKQNIGPDTIIHDLREIRDVGILHHKLTIGKSDVRLDRVNVRTITQRMERRIEIKRQLGRALWEHLFQITMPGQRQAKVQPTPEFQRKLNALRNKTDLSLLVDAGSTNLFACEELLTVDQIPIKTTTPGGLTRIIRPTILTNSGLIVKAARESKHEATLQVTVIGGEMRVDRGSICGLLAELCLDAWQRMRGDIAIIGTTGVADNFSGSFAFGCDDVAEARIKTRLLEMAWLKVLIFDSSKLLYSTASNIFVPLSSNMVDLIVTDDGKDIDADSNVAALKLAAQEAKVATLIVSSEPRIVK